MSKIERELGITRQQILDEKRKDAYLNPSKYLSDRDKAAQIIYDDTIVFYNNIYKAALASGESNHTAKAHARKAALKFYKKQRKMFCKVYQCGGSIKSLFL